MDFGGLLQTLPLQETLFSGVICIAIIAGLVLSLLIGIWVYRDAESRGMSGVLWLIVVLVGGLIGLLIYLIVRSDHPVGPHPVGPPGYYPPYSPGYPAYPGYYPTTPYPPPTAPAAPQGPPATATPAAAGEVRCKACGATSPAGAKFCRQCGATV